MSDSTTLKVVTFLAEVYLISGPFGLLALAKIACKEAVKDQDFRSRLSFLGLLQSLILSPLYLFISIVTASSQDKFEINTPLTLFGALFSVGIVLWILQRRGLEYRSLLGWQKMCLTTIPVFLLLLKYILL